MGAFLRRKLSASPYKNKPHVDSGAKVQDDHMGMGRKKRQGWKNIPIRSYSFIPYFVSLQFGKLLGTFWLPRQVCFRDN